jgi:anthranilate synthase/aminodeoxychorismate synthase-like glutamine amidotransferase
MILLIDNYDSFVYNLARYFELLNLPVEVVRHDQISLEAIGQRIETRAIRCVVLSPGPGTPEQAGICLPLVSRFFQAIPLLGVCLGHQVIAQALGGDVVQWKNPVHGQADWIHHDEQHDFLRLPSPFMAGRYHSLIVREDTLPSFFDVSARLADGTIMGLRHKRLPIAGYQFHPESILTPSGLHLLHGFARWVRLPVSPETGTGPLQPDRPAELQADYPPGCQPRRPSSGTATVTQEITQS